jgi:hypothetical protein
MSRTGIYATTKALIMFFILGSFNSALAGEKLKIKASATSINTKWNQIVALLKRVDTPNSQVV